MIDELFGPLTKTIFSMLPLEIVSFITVVLILFRTGTLERMAKTLNLWIQGAIDSRKAEQHFNEEIMRLEQQHDTELERIIAENQLTSRTADNIANQRIRDDMFEVIKAQIRFLQNRIIILESFIMVQMTDTPDLSAINMLYEEQLDSVQENGGDNK